MIYKKRDYLIVAFFLWLYFMVLFYINHKACNYAEAFVHNNLAHGVKLKNRTALGDMRRIAIDD